MWFFSTWNLGGCNLVQKTLRGFAANMGSKINLLVYEWPLLKCKSGIWMGWFFKIWPNLSQNWLKFKKILEKIGNFVQNLAQNWADWYMNGLLFLEKLVFVWVYFQIPWRHIPTKTKLEYPPGTWNRWRKPLRSFTVSPLWFGLTPCWGKRDPMRANEALREISKLTFWFNNLFNIWGTFWHQNDLHIPIKSYR